MNSLSMKKTKVTQELSLFTEDDFMDKGSSEQPVCDEAMPCIEARPDISDVMTISQDNPGEDDSKEDVAAGTDAAIVEAADLKQLRSSNKKLRVTFPDSDTLCYSSATATFIETLKRIGVDRLNDVNLYIKDVPLFSKEINPRYKDFTKPIGGGWYAIIQSDTDQKYMQLSSIKQQLGLDIKIEIGADFETDKADVYGKKSPKDKMIVKFPDGEYIASTRPASTFVLALEKIGISKLYQKKIQFGSKQLITTSKNYTTQVQSSNGYWVSVPNTSKDKYKQLKVIAAHMHINLDVKIM